ncbi:hypothetical protein OG978_43905 (plasmid) [Streptomyces sp. NBC_01591]|uniref:hypothetical protein n=1 Tax=Streptomyces sp. NBC_01591 TaxID=2975888 RepID=UPI002DDC723D|nr:hypothetical protein [Streptomyces sp. NBC_01591]WSD74089.1 hypothetical protein OG978_43905 [Streptomyces sp. NBC_01591]
MTRSQVLATNLRWHTLKYAAMLRTVIQEWDEQHSGTGSPQAVTACDRASPPRRTRSGAG